jgi:hypothetical protein
LPAAAPYDGETFVDLVSSSPGSTLRIMAWTRLTGDVPAGEGVDLARAIVRLVASRCPAAQLDRATRRFLDGQGQAAQLPDIAALDGHDELLARAEDPTGSPSAS